MKNSLVRAIRTHENGPILLSIHPYVLYIYSVTILLVYNHVWLGPDNNSYTQALQGVSDHLLRTRLLILSLAFFRDFSGQVLNGHRNSLAGPGDGTCRLAMVTWCGGIPWWHGAVTWYGDNSLVT